MLATQKVLFTGEAPLLMHNARLANPSDAVVLRMKKLTSKQKKTPEDHEALSLLEIEGGCYTDSAGVLVYPTDNFESAVIGAAKTRKLGALLKRSAFCCMAQNGEFREGGKQLHVDSVVADRSHHFLKIARVGAQRVMRSRPVFFNWTVELEYCFDSSVVDPDILKELVVLAGQQIGLGDWRPKFGRFSVEFI